MSKRMKWIILALVLILLAGAAAAVFGFLLPYQRARSTMPVNGILEVAQQEDGNLLLSWPEADRADYYCVEVLLPAESQKEDPELVYKDYIEGANSCLLPELPANTELTVRISSVVKFSTLGSERIRFGDNDLEVTSVFSAPVIENMEWTADADTKSISIAFQMQDGDRCRLYLVDEQGQKTEMRNQTDSEILLTFGDDGELEVPGFEEQYTLLLDAYREQPGLTFYGAPSAELTVVRDDLLGRDLGLVFTEEEYNVCTLTWDETKGEHYEVQMMDEQTMQWMTVAEIPADGERTYTSPHMAIYSEFLYRVVAVGGQTMEDSEFAAVSEEKVFATKESPIYCTIWPVSNLEAYTDTQKTEAVGKVEVGAAYCVLEEKDGMFGIRLDGQLCYIDSNYCMINLPEYVGDQCAYNITNSYSSIYMVHEYEIPKVTDVVTGGYEKVRLDDGGYLVPLLYPTAKKLVVAAETAIDQGYRLKIYDSFRPYKATREIYDLTAKILEDPIPSKTFTGRKVSLPSPEVNEEGEAEPLTYKLVMTNNSWSLGSFLARNGSLHNLGIAVDLTLEEISSGDELGMQTSMHDLSWYSVLSRNNTNANTLASIMKGAGFGDLVSEWWHFQDDEIRAQLTLPSVSNGVRASCWMADDNGWKYRADNGQYYKDTTATIDGVEYSFDADGYMIES